jgi:putative ABC transport system permease protein
MIKSFWNIAWRNLARNKVYSFINIAGLSLGLACAMLIILYTKDESSFDRFHKNGESIYRIIGARFDENGKQHPGGGNTGYFHGPAFERQIPEITQVVRYQGDSKDVKKGTEVIREGITNVDSNFFEVFHFPLLQGNVKMALNDPFGIVINEDIAKKYFGTVDVVGKTIEMKLDDDFKPYTITAVAKRCPQNSSIKFTILMPMQVPEAHLQDKENWFNFFLNTFVVLAPGADKAMVESKMKRVYESDAKEVIAKMRDMYDAKGSQAYLLQSLKDLHLGVDYGVSNGLSDGSNPWYSYILTGIALFILLIACINFINLTIARSIKRSREIGIRKVVGGTRKQLIVQFIGESFLLTLFAFFLALFLVEISLSTFNRLANKELSFSYLLDARLISFYLSLLIVTALLAGFYPALLLSGFQPVKTLYGRFSFGGKSYLQKGLVVLQFSLATLLVISTITIYRQFNFMVNTPLGYDDTRLVSVEKWNMKSGEFNRFEQELLSNNLITGIAPSNNGYWGTGARVNGEQNIHFAIENVNENYIPVLGIQVIKGRNFKAGMPTDSTNHIIVNESFVKETGWKEPLGQEVNFFWKDNKRYKVIGVVKDYHFSSLNEKIGPQLLTWNPDNFGEVYIKFKPGSDSKALEHITASFKKTFPYLPYSYSFLSDDNKREYEAEAKWRQMMLFGAALTIFISCIGLFGLSVLNAEKRTKEVGIRKVLGASVSHVVAKLSVDFLQLVFLSFTLSMPMAWYAGFTWLENYPYRIEMGWAMFVLAAFMVLVIAMVTISFQAIRAAIANPVKSLRNE